MFFQIFLPQMTKVTTCSLLCYEKKKWYFGVILKNVIFQAFS